MPGVPLTDVPTLTFKAGIVPLIVAHPLRLTFPVMPTLPPVICFVWVAGSGTGVEAVGIGAAGPGDCAATAVPGVTA